MMLHLSLNLCLALTQQPADLRSDPRLDKHVSYQTVAARAKPAIAGLAAASGLPLAAGGTIQSEILLLHVADVPLRDVMVRLGHAAAATWVLENGTYYLSRTDADTAKRSAADRARLAAGLKKEFAKQAKELAAEKPFDAATAKAIVKQLQSYQNPRPSKAETGGNRNGIGMPDIYELQRMTPTGRLAARVFAHLDPEALAQAQPRRRTVFSTNPTRMEAPLHVELGDAGDAFVAEQGIYADEMETNSERDRAILGGYQGQGFFLANRAKLAAAKLNVIVSRFDDNMDGIGLEVQLYDSAGARMSSAQYTVQIDPDFPSEKELMPDPNEQKLAIPPDDMALMQVIGSTIGGKPAKVTVLPDLIRKRLLRPDLSEPLASFASSLLLGAADAKHLNLVADLPDAYVVLGASPGFTGLPTATSILKLAQALPPSIGPVTVDDKWIEVAAGQASPGAIMGHRANREALGQLFVAADDYVLPIPALARYAYMGEGVPDDFMFLLLQPLLFPGSDVNGSEQWQTLKLIGALIHRQADAPLKSGRIPISSLDPESLAQLENIVFYQKTNGLMTKIAAGGQVWGGDDPCEVMPNGLPRDGGIDVTITEQESVFTTGPRPQKVNPNQLAFNMEMQEHPEKYGGGRPTPTITDRFQVGLLRQYQLHVQLADGISKDMSVQEKHLGHGGELTFSQLSKEFRDQYQQSKDSFDKPGQ